MEKHTSRHQRSSTLGFLISMLIIAVVLCSVYFLLPPEDMTSTPLPVGITIPSPQPGNPTNTTDPTDPTNPSDPDPVVGTTGLPAGQIDPDGDNIIYYYYESISGQRKENYEAVLSCLESFGESTAITGDADELLLVQMMVVSDHPELFWVDYRYSYYVDALSGQTTFKPKYLYTKSEAEEQQKEIDAYAESCYELIDDSMTDIERLEVIYKYIIDHTKYVHNLPWDQTIVSVMARDHQSVCTGYSKTAQYLMQRVGIESVLECGDVIVGEGGSHAWNAVFVDGGWYIFDCTWGDMGEIDPGLPDAFYPNYSYFCITTEEKERSRTTEYQEYLPECTAVNAEYYRRHGMLKSSYNMDEIGAEVAEALSNGEIWTTKFENKGDYQKCLSDFQSGAYWEVMNQAVPGASTFNSYDDELYVIWIYAK